MAKSTVITPVIAYDYINQAWVRAGRYIACGHPESMACRCYGKVNAGREAEWDYLPGTNELTPIGALVSGGLSVESGYCLVCFAFTGLDQDGYCLSCGGVL